MMMVKETNITVPDKILKCGKGKGVKEKKPRRSQMIEKDYIYGLANKQLCIIKSSFFLFSIETIFFIDHHQKHTSTHTHHYE